MLNAVQTPSEVLYMGLFHPVALYESVIASEQHDQVRDNHLITASLVVVLVTLLTTFSAPGLQHWPVSVIPFVITVAFRLSGWFFAVFAFTLTSYIFEGAFHLRRFMILAGYAVLPWIFVPILKLLPLLFGLLGQGMAVVGVMGLALWTSVLFVAGLKLTFNISGERLVALVALPFLMMLVGAGWLSGVLTSLVQWTFGHTV